VVTHHVDADDPSTAFALSRLDDPSMAHVPMGIFRSVQRPDVRRPGAGAGPTARSPPPAGRVPTTTWSRLLHGKDTWTVGA
jgi:2-oxoglutarate ferredoxin oxidoreductase subunit beta